MGLGGDGTSFPARGRRLPHVPGAQGDAELVPTRLSIPLTNAPQRPRAHDTVHCNRQLYVHWFDCVTVIAYIEVD